jgi:type I restriction enzyme, S subunit
MSFPRYKKTKPSGVKWLADVPEHWEVKPLKAVASFNDEVLPESFGAEEEIEYVDIGSVSLAGGVERMETMQYGNAPSRARRKVRDGDVIASTVRTYLKAIAPIIDPPANMIVSTGFAVIRPSLGLIPHFAKFALQTNFFVDAVISLSTGVSYPAINASGMAGIAITVPPLSEQTQIAAFLDRETAKIDALVAEQRRLMELLKEKRQAVISHAVTQGLNPKAQMKPSGIRWIGNVPLHWGVVPLKHVCKIESGHTPQKSNEQYWIEEDCSIPWISLNDTKTLAALDFIDDTVSKISALGMNNSSAHLIEADAVVMNRDGARVGLAAITTKPMCVSQHIIAWVCGESVFNQYLLHVLYAMNDEIYGLTGGATIPTIGMGDIREMTMPLPPLNEQKKIVEHLLLERQRFDTLTAESQRAIDLLQERRTALISAAATGQIDVRS